MAAPGTLCHGSRLLPAENVGTVGTNDRNPATMRHSGRYGNGDKVGTEWGQIHQTKNKGLRLFIRNPLF